MEEIFCMEWNMEEIFRYGMEDGMEKNCWYGIWKNRLPFHSITCPDVRTKIRVESSSVQIVLPIPILRNEKSNGEQIHCIY